ncbi:hypothetical protein Pla52n_70670 [Stieleria varia]|uniref:Uncharacterized protein n=1 Tax=Stieleria varia TaxID=2528005 RepID=A0A5C5ZIY7_9BACT|nr:hypothetical protein Pla52n_70670 [Stieleria varia]
MSVMQRRQKIPRRQPVTRVHTRGGSRRCHQPVRNHVLPTPHRLKRRCTFNAVTQVESCSRDPIANALLSSKYYHYTDGSPLTKVDQLGLCPSVCLIADISFNPPGTPILEREITPPPDNPFALPGAPPLQPKSDWWFTSEFGLDLKFVDEGGHSCRCCQFVQWVSEKTRVTYTDATGREHIEYLGEGNNDRGMPIYVEDCTERNECDRQPAGLLRSIAESG